MSNGYDLTAGITDVLNTYLDNKSKERIAYTKALKPELKVVDGVMYKYNPRTDDVVPITGKGDHWGQKTTDARQASVDRYQDSTQIWSTRGIDADMTQQLISSPINNKSDYTNFNKNYIKSYDDIANYNVVNVAEGLRRAHPAISDDFWDKHYTIKREEIEVPIDPKDPSKGTRTVNEVTDIQGRLATIIHMGSLATHTNYIQNELKPAITREYRRVRDIELENLTVQKTNLMTTQRYMQTAHEKFKGQSVINILTASANAKNNKLSAIQKEVLQAEERYLSALYPKRDIISPLNVHNMSTKNADFSSLLSTLHKDIDIGVQKGIFNENFIKDLQNNEEFYDKNEQSLKLVETEVPIDPNDPSKGTKIVQEQKLTDGAYTIKGLNELFHNYKKYKQTPAGGGLTLSQLNLLPYIHSELFRANTNKMNDILKAGLNSVNSKMTVLTNTTFSPTI